MDDDAPDWLTASDEPEPEPKPAAKAAPAAKAEAAAEAPAAEEAQEGGEAEEPAAEEAPDEYLDPDKLLLFKHWIRPKFLGYKYLTLYRHNYYDDVIDYLDKRNRGITRDIPVAQTWAERALRTYTKNSNNHRSDIFKQKLEDKKLVEETKASGKFQLHHGRNYIMQRYYSICF